MDAARPAGEKMKSMKIVYLGRQSRRSSPAPTPEGDVIELLANNWDDYGNKTTFGTTCRIGGKLIDLGHLKLMIEGEPSSESYLDRRLKEGWDGVFPVPDANYVSLPAEITFYEYLRDHLTLEVARQAAIKLRDASFLVHLQQDPTALALIDSEPFQVSLLRERSETKSYRRRDFDGYFGPVATRLHFRRNSVS